MLPFRIAIRFLKTSPVQSGLIMGGIAIGIAVQIFVGSLITSLQANLIDTTIGSSPQITLQNPVAGDPIDFTARVEDVMRSDPQVKPGTIVPIRQANALYTDASNTAPLNLLGGELRQIDGIYKLSAKTVEGKASLGPQEIMVGADFAKKYNVKPGDSIALAFRGQATQTFTVSGIFDLGSAAFNGGVGFVNSAIPRDLYGWSNNQYSAVYAQLKKPFESSKVVAAWRQQLPGIEITDWQSQNASLLQGLSSQTSSSIIIQSFVLVAVALGIASTLAISAVQKTRQIGILKAMGMGDRPSGRIFLFQALLLGGLGAIGGVALAYVLLWGFSFSPAPFTVTVEPRFAALSAGIGIAVALASSIIPSRRTSSLDPIEVIQNG